MERINGSAVAKDLHGAGKDGFRDGNKALGIDATVVNSEFMNSVQEEIIRTIEAGGLLPSAGSNTQLLQAILNIRKTSDTPPQFDKSLNTSTTEFVQRALGNYAGSITHSVSGNISAASAGNLIAFDSATPITMTLPSAATVPDGASYFMLNGNAGLVTVQAFAGQSIFYLGDGVAKVPAISAGVSLLLRRLSSTSWQVIGGTNQLGFSTNFGAVLSGNGYQKLPSGLIIQWGVAGASIASGGSAVMTLPIAAPNAVLQAFATPLGSGASGTAQTSLLKTGNFTTSGFTIYHDGGVVALLPRWFAITY